MGRRIGELLQLDPDAEATFGGKACGLAMLVYSTATRALKAHREALDLLTSGIASNPTTQISRTIDELVEAARPLTAVFMEPLSTMELLSQLANEPTEGPWLARPHDFLRRFGHRGPMEFDLGARRWSEDPTMIVELVRAGLRSPARESVRARMDRLAAARRRALDEALTASSRWRRPLMRPLARRVGERVDVDGGRGRVTRES